MKGSAMGAKCSGSYSDLFMGRFEGLHIYPRINNKHNLYTRYKDNIFLIWTDGEASLKKFFDEINSIHPSIKFDCHYSREKVNFLDTYIHLNAAGCLSISLFTKPTDRNTFLHHDSYHPQKLLENIPYGQFLRVKKICLQPEDADLAMDAIERKFRDRGFPQELTEAQRQRTNSVARSDLLIDKKRDPTNRTPFTTTYNHHHPLSAKSSTSTGIFLN